MPKVSLRDALIYAAIHYEWTKSMHSIALVQGLNVRHNHNGMTSHGYIEL